jgi:hypothetical protein
MELADTLSSNTRTALCPRLSLLLKKDNMNSEPKFAYVVTISQLRDNMHNPYQTLFLLLLEDAQKLCSDERTRGSQHMLCYFEQRENDKEQEQKFQFIENDGRYDSIIKELNIRVFEPIPE